TVIQKGGSQKLLVLSEAAEVALADYLSARSDSCPALFVYDGARTDEPLSYKEAMRGWNRLCAEVGVKRFTNHQIRHSCATELLRQKVDSLVIAKHMGHRDLKAISGYAQVGLDVRHEMLEVFDDRIAA